MRWHILLYPLLVVVSAETARADALVPATQGSCLSSDVNALRAMDGGQVLYRIVFLNRCDQPRTFIWCAEHAHTNVPSPVACRSQSGFGVEARHTISYRKEFQWHLPAGVRIRFQDCPNQEIPTADFHCAPQATSASRR